MPEPGPLVSIVIPSYNHAAHLRAAIESVLAQDYPDTELIVIDDGSTDGSPEILASFGRRFHWERQSNSGQADALNKGWHRAHGEILAYLSADDLLFPDAVRRSVDALRSYPDAVLTYCDFNLIDPQSRLIRRVRAPDFDYRRMVTQLVCPPGPGAFFRRSAWRNAGPWNPAYRQHGDLEFWLRLGLQGGFHRIPEVLAAFRVHPGSQSFASQRGEEPPRMMQEYFANPRLPAALQAAKDQALSSAYLESARLYFRSGEYRRSFAACRTAFALYPRHLVSTRTLRLAFNALFNRAGHRLLWLLRRARGAT